MTDALESHEELTGLTGKQAEVLSLLVQHKTTKQIARELQISANTVDQRILGVRKKWGTADRKETARVYAHLLETCGKSTCGLPVVDSDRPHSEQPSSDLPRSAVFQLSDFLTHGEPQDWRRSRWGPETLDVRFGKLWRIAAIPILAVLTGMVMIWALAFANELADLI
jgi:DNA-binding CsgD family transcriptional regulator